MDKLEKDFKLFAKDKKNISSHMIDDYNKKISNTIVTPYVLEERNLNVASYDIFSRLLLDRIIYFGSDFNSDACNVTIAQLLYLSSVDGRDINIYINSHGGSVFDGLGVIDTMNFINCDVSTTSVGMAASMGAVLLSSGEKGKRFSLPNSRIMIHQPASSMKGTASQFKIEYEEMMKCQKTLYEILSKNMNRPYEEIESLCDRDKWFSAKEGIEFGLIDKILEKQN